MRTAGLEAMPDDLLELFERCEAAGLYGPDDRASLPAMLAADVDGTRWLIERMAEQLGPAPEPRPAQSCRLCRHYRRPGLSDGYCSHPDGGDSPAYGLLRHLPADGGLACEVFSWRE